VDLSKLVEMTLTRLHLKIKQKNASVKLNIPETSLMISGDAMHLSGAIENLIDNALKYSSDNCKISISVSKNGLFYSINIEDNGVGIKKNELEKIFHKFYRIQHGNIQNDRGFGIGLNYVKYVIDAHNGKISVSSIPGEGSCFKILLPFNECKANNTSNGRR
jgi:two-component system phosphate regulon sensor histidine kinase PhoR